MKVTTCFLSSFIKWKKLGLHAPPIGYQNAENALKDDIQSQKPSTGGGIMKGGALSSHSMANSAAKKSSQVGFNQSVKGPP